MVTNRPDYRFKLRAKVHECGWKSLNAFSKDAGIHPSRMSALINSWIYPSPAVQAKLCKALGISMAELKALL